MFKEIVPLDKKPILTDYLKHKVFYMDDDKAEKFNQLFDYFLYLLSLKYDLKVEVMERQNYSIDVFAKTNKGKSNCIMVLASIFHRGVGYWKLNTFNVQISKDFDLSVNVKPNFRFSELTDWHFFNVQHGDEQGMLDMLEELVRVI